MFGIGMFEWLLIAGLALVVIGPEKFPDFAKVVIKTVRDLRGYMDEMKKEVTKELTPLKKEMDTLSRIDPEKYIDSLTGADDEDHAKKSTPPKKSSMNEEDRKVMEGAADDAFGDDPYGWKEGEDSHYVVDADASPESTVGYGATDPDDCVPEGGEVADDSDELASSCDEATGSEESSAPVVEPDLVMPEDDRIELVEPFDDGEPDVWTGR